MSVDVEEGLAEPRDLPCSTIIYRLARNKRAIEQTADGVRFFPVAFELRPDEAGVSVYLAEQCSLEEAVQKLNPCHGVCTLHVGRIRDLGLDVEADSAEAAHANIVGLPNLAQETDPATIARGIFLTNKLAA